MMKSHELALAISDAERAASYSVSPIVTTPDAMAAQRTEDARERLAELRAMTRDNPTQQKHWDRVAAMMRTQQIDYAKALQARDVTSIQVAVQASRSAQQASIALIETAIQTENELLSQRRENLRDAQRNMTITLAFVALLAVALLVVAIRGLLQGARAARLKQLSEAQDRELHERSLVEADLKEALDRQKLLLDELNHRVKNSLATVQSIAVQTKNSALVKLQLSNDALSNIALYYEAFENRLLSLSSTHDLLVKGSWSGVSLKESIEAALRPLIPAARATIEGPVICLSPNAAVTLNMIFHELSTNAIKYGAMANDVGSVKVTWKVMDDELQLEWCEQDGPPVVAPEGLSGFGTRLIERGVGRELKGTHTLGYHETGFTLMINLPISNHITIPAK
jgi:two-component sensor histidine kinase